MRRLVERDEVDPARIAVLTGVSMPAASGIAHGYAQWNDLRVAPRSKKEGVFATRIDKAKRLERPVAILCDVQGAAAEQMLVGITRGQTML